MVSNYELKQPVKAAQPFRQATYLLGVDAWCVMQVPCWLAVVFIQHHLWFISTVHHQSRWTNCPWTGTTPTPVQAYRSAYIPSLYLFRLRLTAIPNTPLMPRVSSQHHSWL